jgi:hypothetical protein
VPGEGARFRLLEQPLLQVFDDVMVFTDRPEITFARNSTIFPGQGMVLLAPDRWPAASLRGADRVPGLDQVPELATGQPPGFLGMVVARSPGDRGKGDLEPADHVLG